MTLLQPKTRHWTKAEYVRLADEGYFAGQRVQLIRGEILQISPQGFPHTKIMMRMADFLGRAFGEAHWIRTQLQIDVSDDSQPEPDVAVTEHPFEWYQNHPTTALLAVEISDSSLRLDRRKAGLYASAGIPEYWIVNIPSRKLEVYRKPLADANQEFGHRYSDVCELSEEEIIAPLSRPDAKILVKKFFE